MIFAFVQDGTLSVLPDLSEARRRFASSDVETGAVRFFDERGAPLAPAFPHRSPRRFLGIRIGEDAGPFELRPAAERDAESLAEILDEVHVLMGDARFPTLDAVRAHLGASGDAAAR